MLFSKLSVVIGTLIFLLLAVPTNALPKKKEKEELEPAWGDCPAFWPTGVNCLEPLVCEAQWPSGTGNYDEGKGSLANFKRGADVLSFDEAAEFMHRIFQMMQNNSIVWSDDKGGRWNSPQFKQGLETEPIHQPGLSPRDLEGDTITLTAPTTIHVALPSLPTSVSTTTLIVTETEVQNGPAESSDLPDPEAGAASEESIETANSAEPVTTQEVTTISTSTTRTSSSRPAVSTIPAQPATCCRPTAECWAFIQTTGWFARDLKSAKPINHALTWKKAICCVATYLSPHPRCPNGGHKINNESLYWLRPPQCSETSNDLTLLRAYAAGQGKIIPVQRAA